MLKKDSNIKLLGTLLVDLVERSNQTFRCMSSHTQDVLTCILVAAEHGMAVIESKLYKVV